MTRERFLELQLYREGSYELFHEYCKYIGAKAGDLDIFDFSHSFNKACTYASNLGVPIISIDTVFETLNKKFNVICIYSKDGRKLLYK